MMLGLKRGTVTLIPHQTTWKKDFEKEKQLLEKIIGRFSVCIEHCGSTSIPHIAAKPIIDILVGVKSLESSRAIIPILKKAGYDFRQNSDSPRLEFLFAKGPESNRTHYIHVARYNGARWNKTIGFRDHLIMHKSIAKQYEKIKQRLAQNFPNDRAEYTKAKKYFISEILKKIV